jgi:hypothetical protein
MGISELERRVSSTMLTTTTMGIKRYRNVDRDDDELGIITHTA